MIKKGYKLVSTEEIKPFASFDKNNFGGKQMWEERLSNLDTLFGKLFIVLVVTSVLVVASGSLVVGTVISGLLIISVSSSSEFSWLYATR